MTGQVRLLARHFFWRFFDNDLVSPDSDAHEAASLIIAALLHDPDILIFDEPLSGLDVTAAMVFRQLVQQLAAAGKTILYSSHVLDVVEKLCSKVIVLYHGEVVANDSVEHLRETLSRGSLEEVFAQLVFREDPERVARDIADVIAARR